METATTTRPVTKQQDTLAKIIRAAYTLLETFENDVETGIDEGIYDPEDNIETRAFIKECHELFDQYPLTPAIYIYVEGGNIQGASATMPISFNLYDKDCLQNDEEYEQNNGTPEQWDEMITNKTEQGEIIPIY